MRNIVQYEGVQKFDFWQQYLSELVFAQTPHRMKDVGLEGIRGAEPVVVYFGFDARPPADLLTVLEQSTAHSLVHLCDERLQHDTVHYAKADAVLRCYYDPRVRMENVFAIPPGFQSGFLNREPVDFGAKDLVWCFAGQVKSSRKKMLGEFSALRPNATHLTGQWNDPKGLGVEDMAALYKRAIFAPCPVGYRNPDSFRVLECLEHGCIPVVISFLGEDYFRYVYGDHPFVIASTWAKATDEIRGLIADPPSLRARQQRLAEWYAGFKSDLSSDVRDILGGCGREHLRSKQFHYQLAGMGKLTLRLYDLYFGHGLIRRLFRTFCHLRS